MPNKAKVFARVFDYSVPAGLVDSSMRFTVEFKLLVGTKTGGKVAFVITDIHSEDKLKDDLRDLLADYLTEKFAPLVFRPRDIVGYSV